MKRTPYQIPLKPRAQKFNIALGGIDYQLTLRYNADAPAWMLSIAGADGTPIVNNIPLVTGRNLLAPYYHLGFQGALIAQTDHDSDAVPTYANLGQTGRLYFVTR